MSRISEKQIFLGFPRPILMSQTITDHRDDRAADVEVKEQPPSHLKLGKLIEQAGGLLPSQGPLGGFAFLNPLQGLEDLPFPQGMLKGSRLYGCQPYLRESVYREKLASGRIVLEDVKKSLSKELGDSANTPVVPSGTRFDLRLAMMEYPVRSAPTEELRWFIAETDALTRFAADVPPALRKKFVEETRHWIMRDVLNEVDTTDGGSSRSVRRAQALIADLVKRFGKPSQEDWDGRKWESFAFHVLWRVCRQGVELAHRPTHATLPLVRHRDFLYEAAGEDSDLLVHPVLIRFCASFSDQGISTWMLPDRERGFFRSFSALYREAGGHRERWMETLPEELRRIQVEKLSPMESLLESLEILGVEESEWPEFIEASLLALRGWAGIIWQMEVREDRVPKPAPKGSLIEFLAVRLLLERLALRYLCRKSPNVCNEVGELRKTARDRMSQKHVPSLEQRTFSVFQLAQVMGWNPSSLLQLNPPAWTSLVTEIESFPQLERRRIFQLAFEQRFLVQTLDALPARKPQSKPRATPPRFQSVYCIDAREESFRRHLEEIAPDAETFGAAGFFGVAMYFRGIADAHFVAQCPIVVRPKHWVVEDMLFPFEKTHQFRSRSRRVLGLAAHQVHLDSRSFAPGAILSAGLGTLASIPLVMRVLFPEFTAKVRRAFGRIVAPPMMTRLRLERTGPTAGPENGGIGFSIEEMAGMGERMLRDIGLTSGFSRLVFFIGHGSACQNNPHKSTYDCGACTGNPGGQNGRALAAMLNNPRVRDILASHGLVVPADTMFLGGLHNTADDTVTFFDLDQLPKSHFDDFEAARQTFDAVCRRNSHERCRRFFSAPLDLSIDEAHRHVKDRSEDLAQTRPEFGNASNAICIVGRRSRSQGLYLDRRSFMQSYDPTQDTPDHSILERILSAVVPVCSGINMQYYLSAVDSPGWGCGTKLPHNVVSLLGVMDGASSDLRCGLPGQSVEIHEPVRLLFVIETTPEGILQIMKRNAVIGRILGNGWAQLAVLDPNSNRIHVYSNGEFQLYEPSVTEIPRASSSIEWYRGWRDHLPFAVIDG
jgi:uncharacterized protein